MTHDDHDLTPAHDPLHAAVDALLDGEAVEKDTLREALADAAIRDYFIDLLLLRRMAMDMGPTAFHVPARPLSPATRAVRWVAAAAVVITTAAGGYAIGRDQQPPAPAAPTLATSTPSSSPEAPAPTRTIRFERGKNWISNLEGN